MKSRPFKEIISLIIIIAAGYFIFRTLKANWYELKTYSLRFNLNLLLLSFFSFIPSFIFYVLAWLGIIYGYGKRVSFLKGCQIIAVSNMGKYIPGKVWFALSRAQLLKNEGVDNKTVVASIFLESGFLLMAAILLSLINFINLKAITGLKGFRLLWLLPLLIVLIGFLIHPKTFNWFFNKFLTLLKREKIFISLTSRQILKILGYYLAVWISQGIGFFLLISAFYKLSGEYLINIIGIYALSWMIGFLVFIVPGGIGVREGSLIYLLKSFLPISLSTVVALVSRIWLTIMEVIFFLIWAIFLPTIKKIRS